MEKEAKLYIITLGQIILKAWRKLAEVHQAQKYIFRWFF